MSQPFSGGTKGTVLMSAAMAGPCWETALLRMLIETQLAWGPSCTHSTHLGTELLKLLHPLHIEIAVDSSYRPMLEPQEFAHLGKLALPPSQVYRCWGGRLARGFSLPYKPPGSAHPGAVLVSFQSPPPVPVVGSRRDPAVWR